MTDAQSWGGVMEAPSLIVDPHQPYLMGLIPENPVGRLNLGIWIECECGWIGGNNTASETKAFEAHRFHRWLAETYPKGEGLEISRLRAKCWVLVDSATKEQASPKAPQHWGEKRTAERALRILRNSP